MSICDIKSKAERSNVYFIKHLIVSEEGVTYNWLKAILGEEVNEGDYG